MLRFRVKFECQIIDDVGLNSFVFHQQNFEFRKLDIRVFLDLGEKSFVLSQTTKCRISKTRSTFYSSKELGKKMSFTLELFLIILTEGLDYDSFTLGKINNLRDKACFTFINFIYR